MRVASISDGSDNMGWLVRSELVILVESHVTIFFNAGINIHLILSTFLNNITFALNYSMYYLKLSFMSGSRVSVLVSDM